MNWIDRLAYIQTADIIGNESTWVWDNTVVYIVTKYYAFGAQRVAMRQCNSSGCADAIYLHGDHLGSVSLVTDSNGNPVSQARYTPYGELRWPGVSQMPTDFGYTGQRADRFGLMDYNARFYSPHLGKFVSADTFVNEELNSTGKRLNFSHPALGGDHFRHQARKQPP